MKLTYSKEAPTDRLFTVQRLDSTGLYYYNARYYDPLIGRFISADIIIPDPFNPQAFNRYSYCLNNPLKYVDPSGHYWSYEDDYNNYYYESSCAEAGVDPSAGEILVSVGGSWVSMGTTAADFVSWVSDSPEPFDYITEREMNFTEAIQQGLGVESVGYYHMNLTAEPIPVYYVGTEGVVPTLLGNKSGISLYPIGTFVKESAVRRQPYIPAHEGQHYSEQRMVGPFVVAWYAAYGIEIAARNLYYGDTWAGYYQSSFEQRARDWSGEPSLTPPIPWWRKIDYTDLTISPPYLG